MFALINVEKGKAEVRTTTSEGRRKTFVEEINSDNSENSNGKSNVSDTFVYEQKWLRAVRCDMGSHDKIDMSRATTKELELNGKYYKETCLL